MLAVWFFVNSTYFTILKGKHCTRALLAKENRRGEEGARGTRQPWLRVCSPERWPKRNPSLAGLFQRHLQGGIRPFIYSGFQQPSLLKKALFFPFRPSSSISFVITLKETTTFHSWFCIVSKLQNLVIVISYHLDQLLLHFSYLLSFHHQYNPSDSAKFLLLVSPTYFWLISTSFG